MAIAESLTVALPAYNEEANIAAMVDEVVRTVTPLVTDWEVVVVDDGSRDGTAARFPLSKRGIRAFASSVTRRTAATAPRCGPG